MIGSGFEFFAANRVLVWVGRMLIILAATFVMLQLYENILVGLLIGIGLGIIMIRSTIYSKRFNQRMLDKYRKK